MPIGRRLIALVVVAMTAPVWGQTPANQAGPAFEVASVRPSPPADDLVMPNPGSAYPGGRWRASRVGLRLLVMRAYGVRMEQVAGVPSSIASELFDVDARAASPDVQRWRLRNQALSALVRVTAAAAMLGGSVVDRAGLTGTFDIDLDYVPGWRLLGDDPPRDGVPLVTAFEEQLGLKFERIEEPMDVIVIDHVERPDPN